MGNTEYQRLWHSSKSRACLDIWFQGKLPQSFSIKPKQQKLKKRIKDFLDNSPSENLYLSQKQIHRLIELHSVDLDVAEPLCLDIYNKKIRKDGTCITITEPHHNSLRIVHPKKNGDFIVRKLSMTEHYRFMGFRDGQFKFGNQSYQQICKRAGNGWDINLVSKIFQQILERHLGRYHGKNVLRASQPKKRIRSCRRTYQQAGHKTTREINFSHSSADNFISKDIYKKTITKVWNT